MLFIYGSLLCWPCVNADTYSVAHGIVIFCFINLKPKGFYIGEDNSALYYILSMADLRQVQCLQKSSH